MKLSKKDIQTLNRKKSARPGKLYSTFEGIQYVGNQDGTLRPYKKSHKDKLKDNSDDRRLAQAEADIDNLEITKDDIVSVDAKIAEAECKLIAMNIVLG